LSFRPGPYQASETQAVRVVCNILILVLLCSGITGCALFGRSANGNKEAWPTGQQKQPSKQPPVDPLHESPQATGPIEGQLSGQVKAKRTGLPVQASILYLCEDEPQAKGAAVDYLTHDDGYFTIGGLKAGKRYKLVVRSMQEGKLVAATYYATPPNPRILIFVSADFVTKDTPPIAPPATLPERTLPAKEPAAKEGAKGKADQPSTSTKGVGIGTPTPIGEAAPEGNQPADFTYPPRQPALPKKYPENIAREDFPRPNSPAVAIPNPNKASDDNPSTQAPAENQPDTSLPQSPTPVPSAVLLTPQQLVNFAFRDFYGESWEWKVHRKGKVVLLDFWRTTCPPCVASIKDLVALQSQYGPEGLEVIGIATESAGSFAKDRDRVVRLANVMHTNYRMLLNSGPGSQSILDRFGVHSVPTLLVVNERGDILWRHAGLMSASDKEALEHLIRRELRME
jgi:thiol-disulfide isomerase/thioredoxin